MDQSKSDQKISIDNNFLVYIFLYKTLSIISNRLNQSVEINLERLIVAGIEELFYKKS